MNGTLIRQPARGTRVPVPDPVLLADRTHAGSYQVRTAGRDDAAGIREFVCGLSVRTQYFRFFTAVSPPSPGLLRVLTGATGQADILVVTDARGAVVGHGMAVDAPQDDAVASDIGLVIADSWQGQRLGTKLLAMLADRAAGRGVTALVLDVLPDNTRMVGIINRRWPDAGRKRTADSITFTATIDGVPVASDRPSLTLGAPAATPRGSVPDVSDDVDDVVAHNRAAWDREVETGNQWTVPVGPEVIAAARAGNWSVVLIGHDPVPRDWFPAQLAGADVLCLASGGGQQGPVLAAAGARVTVFDNSARQLAQDELVAARDELVLSTVLGDMRDLSAFADDIFDLVFHPVSNVFCPDLAPVWREAFRVLRPGGTLLAGFMNPDIFIFDADANENRGELIVRHALPYSDLTHLDADERERLWGLHAPLEYSHSLTEQIGGQLAAGFFVTGFREIRHDDATGDYMPGMFATRAIKPTGDLAAQGRSR